MKLIDLRSADDLGIALWAAVRKRIFAATVQLAPSLNAIDVVQFIQSRWIQHPDIIRVWVVIDDVESHNGDLPKILGHMIGWVDVAWGKPYIYVFQCEGTKGIDGTSMREPFLASVREWINYLNNLYEKAESPLRIKPLFLFETERDGAFLNYLRPNAKVLYSVVEVNLRQESEN